MRRSYRLFINKFHSIRLPRSPSGSTREALRLASKRNGSVSDNTLDLPVPLLPRSIR